MENCSHARRFLRYSDVVVILKSTVGTRRLHRNARMQRNDFQSSSSFDKNRESRSENSMPLQIGTIPERVLKGEMGTNSLSLLSSGFYTKTSLRAGYSARGETMSQVMGKRPELFTAYLQCSSQWDGAYEPVVENRTPVYIVVGESDEYYGSGPSEEAYENLYGLYREAGLSDEEIRELLVLDIKDAEYFESQGMTN